MASKHLMGLFAEVRKSERLIRLVPVDRLPNSDKDDTAFEFYDQAGNVQHSGNPYLDDSGNPYHDRPEVEQN